MKLKARGIKVVCGLARGCERMDEFCACALAVHAKARDVSAAEASSGDQQVVARATGDAAQLQLARRRLCFLVSSRAGESKTRVTLDALAHGEQCVSLRLAAATARVDD